MQLLEVGSPEVATCAASWGEGWGGSESAAGGCLDVGGDVRLQEGSLDALGAGEIPSTFGPEISFHLALA